MASTSETGHPKNVANFENLVSFVVGYGVTYNPSKVTLKVPALQTQLASCKANIASVTSTSVAFNNAVNARMMAFDGLKKLSTRLLNALDATNASTQLVKDFKTVNAKVQGSKLTKADSGKTAKLIDPNAPVVETTKTISSSQQSYSSLIEHMATMITVLSTEPTYVPNENELKVLTLNTLLTSLKNTNTAVINAYTTVSNARLSRDQSLYNTTNGLCETAKEVKMYVKSLYGATSPQYKLISGLEFKSRKV
jgi:acyl-CoA hydrolase